MCCWFGKGSIVEIETPSRFAASLIPINLFIITHYRVDLGRFQVAVFCPSFEGNLLSHIRQKIAPIRGYFLFLKWG